MPELKPEELKQLLTTAERKLVESSQQPSLAKLSEVELKKYIDLTRKARDKWRDQSTQQRRDAQQAQGSRVTDAAARSADKSRILSKALNDLQKQLDKIGSGTEPGPAVPAAKSPSKQQRAKGHRESRAEVRALLEEKRSKLTAESSASKEMATIDVAKKKVAPKPDTSAGTVAGKVANGKKMGNKKIANKKIAKKKIGKKKVAKKPAKKAVKKKVATKQMAKVKTAEKSSFASGQKSADPASRLNLNPSDQRATKTRAKQARIQQSGLTTRTRGHVSARGKRSQGGRDRRG